MHPFLLSNPVCNSSESLPMAINISSSSSTPSLPASSSSPPQSSETERAGRSLVNNILATPSRVRPRSPNDVVPHEATSRLRILPPPPSPPPPPPSPSMIINISSSSEEEEEELEGTPPMITDISSSSKEEKEGGQRDEEEAEQEEAEEEEAEDEEADEEEAEDEEEEEEDDVPSEYIRGWGSRTPSDNSDDDDNHRLRWSPGSESSYGTDISQPYGSDGDGDDW